MLPNQRPPSLPVRTTRATRRPCRFIPVALAVDGSGDIFIAELRHRVRKVDARGIITTVAGDGTAGFLGDGGPGIAARLNSPSALAVTSDGTLFIADSGNQRIRKVLGRR